MDHKVITIRCGNGTEFKNRIMNEFCEIKGAELVGGLVGAEPPLIILIVRLYNVLIVYMLMLFSFGVDAAEDFKKNMLIQVVSVAQIVKTVSIRVNTVRVIEGVVQPVAPTTVEQRLARKNELKARDLEEQSLNDLFNNLKIYEAEVKSSSSASTSKQNIAFVSSQNTDNTNEPVSAVASVFAASAKIHVFALPNVDTLSNVVIYSFFASQSNSPQLDNDDLKKIDADDLEEMDLKCVMAWTAMTGVFRHKKNLLSMPSWHSPFQVLPVLTMRDNALVVLRQKFEKAEQERDELKLKLEKFQTSSKNLSQLLASQTNDKTILGYDTQVFTSCMFDCDELFSSETDESLLVSPIYNMYQSGEGYHAVPPPYTVTFMPHKPDLVFHDAPNVNETVHTAFNVEFSPTKSDKDLSHTYRPSAPIIKDWVSDSEDNSEAELP
nr:hypothetical protein [Tanacetum cinerariifolium]